MGKLFNYDNPLMQALNKIVDCVLLSILWLICSLPIITFGASTSALYYTVNKVIRHNRSHISREFFASFKTNFKQSTIVWLIVILLYYLLSVDCLFVYSMASAEVVDMWVLIPFVLTIVFLTMWVIYAFSYIARFKNTLKGVMKNCAVFVLRHFFRSLSALLVLIASLFVLLFIPMGILIVPAAAMYLITLIMESVFVKYMSEEDLAAEEERNRVYYN